MNDKRKYHLSYCKICKNRSFNLNNGITCRLTNEVADFDESCHFFIKDNDELMEIKSKIENRFKNNNYKYDSHIDKFLFGFNKYKKIQKNQTTFYFDRSFFRVLLILFPLMIIYYTIFQTNIIETSSIEKKHIIYFIINSIIILVLIYINFFRKHHPILVFKDKYLLNNPIFISDIKKNKIYWNDIINLKINVNYYKQLNSIKISVGTITSGIVEIDITGVENNPIEIFELIKSKSENIA